ncbi:flagellar hook-associated protein 2 [Bacillus carboniphilus]|uniref:Flagellar hook-associated protein 2 n=1 Tax=Bacillus carboniphilus TaxID=86663 RepID=A0ABN0VVX2_9BACI
MSMRIGGLASGMDIDQLVSDLMKAERMPLDKLTQKKTFLEWQRDDYREMNKLMFDFDSLIFDGVGKQGTFIQKTISSSNPDAVSVRNINSVSDFSGSVEVHQLAKSATMRNRIPVTLEPDKLLSEQGVTGTQTFIIRAIKPNGELQTQTTNAKGETIEEGFKLTFDPSKETLNSIISKINEKSGVNAFFDDATNQISFTAKNTGNVVSPTDLPEIELVDVAGTFLKETLNFHVNNKQAEANGVGTIGQNADLTYNGLRITRSTNNININGFELTLKKETAAGESVSFSSSPDVDKILETVVKFVDKYNEMIEKMNSKVDEKRYRDYQPLTSEQKEAMSEKEIELWEERAKSGTLRGDSVLQNGLNQMRRDLYTVVEGLTGVSQLAEIGIKTSSNYLEKGKLIIDEDKLRKAISDDPNGVYKLFNGATSNSEGIVDRLRETLKGTMESIEKKAGKSSSTNQSFTIGRNLENIDDRISDFERRLLDIEDRYWRQFTAMEKAIQQSNQQSMFLMNQFGGGM